MRVLSAKMRRISGAVVEVSTAVSILWGQAIAVAVEGELGELVDEDGLGDVAVVGDQRQGLEAGLFSLVVLGWPSTCAGVQALVGGVCAPVGGGDAKLVVGLELAPGHEVALNVFYKIFDGAFLLGTVGVAGDDFEVVVGGHVGVAGVGDGLAVFVVAEDGAFGAIDDHVLGHASKGFEGATMGQKPAFESLIEQDIDIGLAAVTEDDDDEVGLALAVAAERERQVAKVDLRGLAWQENLVLVDLLLLGRTHGSHVAFYHGEAAAVALFADRLVDLLGAAFGAVVQQPVDA